MYYYCKTCGPGNVSKLDRCNKLVIDCDEGVVCPKCKKHIDKNLIKEGFTDFTKALQDKGVIPSIKDLVKLPEGETIASRAMDDIEFDDEPLVGEGADADIFGDDGV